MYLPVDEGFVSHRKTIRFCALMQDHNAFAYILRLWSWAVRAAPDGDLSGLSPADIEMAIQYRLADGRCYAHLVTAGFIDESEPTFPSAIHNWMERIGESIAKMEAAAKASRDRKRRWRNSKGTVRETPSSVSNGVPGSSRPGGGTSTERHRDEAEDADCVCGDGDGDASERAGNAPRQEQARQVQARQDKKDQSTGGIGFPDPLTPSGLVSLVRTTVGNAHPELGMYNPGQWAGKAAREFCDAIPDAQRNDGTRAEIRRRVSAFAACTDKRITKGKWLVEDFCEAYNELAAQRSRRDPVLDAAVARVGDRPYLPPEKGVASGS
jgi:hypothetical protein